MSGKKKKRIYIDDRNNSFLIFKLNLDGTILNCSKKLLKLMSFSEYDIIDKHITSFIDYETSKYTFEDLMTLLGKIDESLTMEHRIVTLFRKYIYVYANYFYEIDNETGEEFILVNLIDITNLKKDIINERKKDIFYEEILYNQDSPIAIVDYNGRLNYCNKNMEKLLLEMNNNYISKIDYNIFGDEISKAIDKVLANEKLKYEFEYSFNVSEETKHFKVLIDSLNGNRCRVTFCKIQKEKIYEEILDKLKIGIVFESKNGITYLNKIAAKIFNVENKEHFKNKKLIEYIGFEYKLKFLEHFQSSDMEEVCFIKSINNKDIIVSTNKNYINERDKKEKIYFIEENKKNYNTDEDILEAKEYESLKNEFFANISHELRTPINVIYSVVQLAEAIDSKKDDMFLKYNKILKQNCYRLIRLINNLIEITKIDSGHIEMSLGNYNIINVVEEITLSVADYIESKGLELIFDTEVEELIIACDPDKIECIILNLLANASKFTTPPGKIEVYIDVIEEEFIKIYIKDNGEGIPQDKQKAIFKRFRQVDKNLYRAHEGSGIGLSLVKSFIELHGGDISVESNVGEGSEFIIQLPIRTLEKDVDKKVESYESEKIIDKINIEFSDIYFNN